MPITTAPTNHAVADRIATLVGLNPKDFYLNTIESILDENYKSRRAGKSPKLGMGGVRPTDLGTSLDAARLVKITPSIVKILRAMERNLNPRVVEEIVASAALPGNSGSTRFCDMRKDGLVAVYDTVVHKGRRKTRYMIAPLGQKWLKDNGFKYDAEGERHV